MFPSRRSKRLSLRARHPVDVTIRPSFPDDAEPLIRLAVLDSSPPILGEALVAEVAGELWAVVSLADGRTIADPFRPSAGLVRLLEFRAAQLGDDALAEGAVLRRLVPLLTGR
jgi:hypothetical protein